MDLTLEQAHTYPLTMKGILFFSGWVESKTFQRKTPLTRGGILHLPGIWHLCPIRQSPGSGVKGTHFQGDVVRSCFPSASLVPEKHHSAPSHQLRSPPTPSLLFRVQLQERHGAK